MVHDERSKFYKARTLDDAFRKKVTGYKMRLSLSGHPIPKLSEAVSVFETLEKREMEKFGQQVGNAIIKRSLSDSPIIEQIGEKMAQP